MEKINIAELLKDCPTGMELDCTMIDNVVFEKLDFISSHHPIIIRRTDSNKTIHLTKYGQYSDEEDYKCVIFPKGKTTWEGFVPPCRFKDGDIIIDSLGNLLGICIFKGEGKIKDTVDYYCGIDGDCFSVKDNKCKPDWYCGNIAAYRLATEKEKEKLFQAIKENGYNWNPETKTLKKLIQPKFKVGDRIRLKNGGSIIEVTSINNDSSICVNGMSWTIKIEQQDNYELVPNKFDINTLVPFESKVLVRDENYHENIKDGSDVWRPAIFGLYSSKYLLPFNVVGGLYYMQCIPYEGNEHLSGNTDDCDEYYKTWE